MSNSTNALSRAFTETTGEPAIETIIATTALTTASFTAACYGDFAAAALFAMLPTCCAGSIIFDALSSPEARM